MKYFTQTLFDATSFGTANTSGVSSQFDISSIAALWLQVTASGTSTSTDYSIQLYVSNDAMNVVRDSSTWIAEGSASNFTGTNLFDKHVNLVAQKAKIIVTRTGGDAVLTVRGVGKLNIASSSAATSISSAAFPLLAPDGSSAAPSYSFATDSQLGFYKPSGNSIMVAIAGSPNFQFSSSTNESRVPLGTVDGTLSNPGFYFKDDINTGILRNGSDDMVIATGGAARIEISNSRVDILNTLAVKSGGSFGAPNLACTADLNTGIAWGEADDLYLVSGGTNKVSIDSGGVVGIELGDLKIKTVGKGLQVKEGSNAKMGTVVLSSGTAVVSTTAVTATSRIFLTAQSLGTVSVGQGLAISARTAGTSFTILSGSAVDTSTVAWMIVEPA